MKAKTSLISIVTITLVAMIAAGCGGKKDVAVSKVNALDASAWNQSEWISAVDAQVAVENDDDRSSDGASWFVSTLKNEGKVVNAKWMTTGLGVKTKAGAENILAAQVTPGWWADKIITPGGMDNVIGKKCAFRGVLEVTYADGSKKLYGTDTKNWKAGIAGPVKHASIFDGEDYDARELPGYETLDKLTTPEVNNEFNGEILPSEGAEIYLRKDIALSPVKAYIWEGVEGDTDEDYGKVIIKKEFAAGETMTVKPGETLVVDFGQNAAAVPHFVFKAKGGTVLTCLPSELLNDGNGAKSRGMDGPEGSCHRRNLRVSENNIRLMYTFADTKDFADFTPVRTFFGYRLVSITATDEVTIKSIESIPVTSIAESLETGKITTGNDLINKLISNTIWGQRSNYLSVPTDCPQRNERLGWMADTQVFTETGTFFANTDGFFHKWTRDVRDSQSEAGGFPGVSPRAQYGNEMMRLGWADAGVIVPWTVWKQFGDNKIIDENWDAMDKFINYVNDTKYDHATHAAENGNYQWADWLSYEPLESCGGGINMTDKSGKTVRRPEAIVYWNYLSACYWAIDADMMADMAAATGRDAAKYKAMAQDAKEYMKKNFLKPDGTFKTEILNTMQTPALFALKNNLVEGKAKEDMIARLRQNFKDHGDCLQTGFLGTSILMATLTENGMVDIAYTLLFQRKNPSWLYSVDNGATTIWERWNSYTIESGMGPSGMNSFNHYAYGAVCEWIWETAAGIASDPANPGFKHIIMKPVPDKRLGSVDAEFNSAAGLIKSAWKYEGDKWIWEFTVPEGANASVTLPGETEVKEYGPGTYKIEK